MSYFSDDDEENPGLNMSLDTLIKNDKAKKKGRGGGRGRGGRGRGGRGRRRGGRGRGRGGRGRGRRRRNGGTDLDESWRGSLAEDLDGDEFSGSEEESFDEEPAPRRRAASGAGISTTGKIAISNLDFQVTSDDVKEIFERAGVVMQAFIKFNKQGMSTGTAAVIYSRRKDAMAAVHDFNGLKVDGRPMTVELVEESLPPQRNGVSAAKAKRKRAVLKKKRAAALLKKRKRAALARRRARQLEEWEGEEDDGYGPIRKSRSQRRGRRGRGRGRRGRGQGRRQQQPQKKKKKAVYDPMALLDKALPDDTAWRGRGRGRGRGRRGRSRRSNSKSGGFGFNF